MHYDIANTILAVCGIVGAIITITQLISKNASKSSSVFDRIITLERGSQDMAKDIKSIKENHLAHIQEDISGINVNLAAINTTLEFLKQK